jgi:hypothetical protein
MSNDEYFDKNQCSKSEINAERILKRIHIHDLDSGGIFTEITGSQGSGKTSVMLSFMDYVINKYPDEKIFWSNCYYAPLQSVKIGTKKHHIMLKQDSNVTFHDRTAHLKQINPLITYFKTFDELYYKAKSGCCNSVFFGDRFQWMEFIHYLRSVGEWCHIYIDEISEICPAFTSGKLWKRIRDFSLDMKEVRKCMLNVHCNTQSVSDCDFRIRNKVMVKIYLSGARTDNISRVSQNAIDNLEENPIDGNEAYLEFSGKFGKTRFGDIYKPNPKMLWEARVNGK